jgi:hypothetical protein
MAALALFLQLWRRQSPEGRLVLIKAAEIIGYLGSERRITVRTQAATAAAAVDSALVELHAESRDDEAQAGDVFESPE